MSIDSQPTPPTHRAEKKMAATQTIHVPHLGGITAGYAVSGSTGGGGQIDPARPTCVLINAMCMTAALYRDQLADEQLASAVNLLAVEPLGHGATSLPAAAEHFTYWDSAVVALQVMEALGVPRVYALGTSQGGWVVARMALLAPEKVRFCCPSMMGMTGVFYPEGNH